MRRIKGNSASRYGEQHVQRRLVTVKWNRHGRGTQYHACDTASMSQTAAALVTVTRMTVGYWQEDDDDGVDGLLTGRRASRCLPVTVALLSKAATGRREGAGLGLGSMWPYKEVQTSWRLRSNLSFSWFAGVWGGEVWGGLSKGATGNAQAQHCLYPTRSFPSIIQSLCSKECPTNTPSPTAELTGLGG